MWRARAFGTHSEVWREKECHTYIMRGEGCLRGLGWGVFEGCDVRDVWVCGASVLSKRVLEVCAGGVLELCWGVFSTHFDYPRAQHATNWSVHWNCCAEGGWGRCQGRDSIFSLSVSSVSAGQYSQPYKSYAKCERPTACQGATVRTSTHNTFD